METAGAFRSIEERRAIAERRVAVNRHGALPRRSIILAILLGALAPIGWSAPGRTQPIAGVTPQPALKADMVIVEKSARRLYLIRKGFVFRTYKIALGRQPTQAKVREGDRRTPEGVYLIDGRNPNSNFHLALHISYPNSHDMAQAAAIGASPGGMIMIHGLPNGMTAARIDHPKFDWTNGCIAVTNSEIEEIWRFVDDGTPIVIRP